MMALKGMSRLKDQIAADKAPQPAPETQAAKEVKPDARKGKQMIAGYFSKELATKVAITARLQGRSIQAFLCAALDAELQRAGEAPFGER